MRLFFGKISKSGKDDIFFEKQISEKRYYSKKDSGWFGEIKENDYCFIIAGEKIYLWKAKEFVKENYEIEYLQFESVIYNSLPIDGNKFKSFKYFEVNPQILVLTTRKARNRAFFKIKYIEGFTEELLKNKSTYENIENFRKIFIVNDDSKHNETDIFLIKNSDSYKLYKSEFIDAQTFQAFRDNTALLGKSNSKRSNKDSTINKIKSTNINDEVKDVSLLSFYDLFFNEYKTKEIDEHNEDEEVEVDEKGHIKMTNEGEQIQPLNQILYGSPGTGKTYNTINKALEIIFEAEKNKNKIIKYKYQEHELEKSIEELENVLIKKIHNTNERKDLKAVFEYFKDEQRGQIEFITFHQSYGYEEFVEGIKAKTNEETKKIEYEIEAGIFKKLCGKAKTLKAQTNKLDFDWNRGNIFKMSLGGKNDSEILDWCLDNEYISMGWGNEIDFSSVTAQSWESFRDKAKSLYQNLDTDRFTLQAMYAFKEWMKKDDLVFVSLGNLKIVAIGQVIGDYEYKENIDEIKYSQFRKVKWLFIDKSGIPVEKLLNKKLSQQTIYNLDKSYVKKDFLDSLFTENDKEQLKNYVLIIDEINRGNISKIFGELITLIEPSKRIAADEEIRVKLPYSGEPFGVPQNLYIIGTMNTADRSIAPIDTALRRRFVFEEMAPKSNLLKSITIKENKVIELYKLLEAINKRIEYLYDRDHTIGHAYLIDVNTFNDLKFAFKNKIIPLLAEYFYEDWENIKLVLDDSENRFITVKEKGNHLALSGMDKNYNKKLYSVNDIDSLEAEDFINIYPKEDNQSLEKDA
jgi:5-methylcytosine-specific restriction enzyme B